MATNPMQRKTRNSFLLGMLLMLVITGVIIAILVMQLMDRIKEENAKKATMVSIYVLNNDVSSGQEITSDMLIKKEVYRDLVPANATSNMDVLETWKMQDKEGNEVYIKGGNDREDNGRYRLYIKRGGVEYQLKQEAETEQYYIEVRNDKEYVELNSVPIIAKVDLNKNTVLTQDLITKSDDPVKDDVRRQEYNIITLPMDLATGDYIDIRITYPNGQDFIVVAKKEVEIPVIDGVNSVDTIWANLSEDEIISMNCAIVEAAKLPGCKIYANKYTDPGMQKAAIPTYILNAETLTQLRINPNIVEESIREITNRYSNESVSIRTNINEQLEDDKIDTSSNLQTNIQQSVTNSQSSRKQYVESLSRPASN